MFTQLSLKMQHTNFIVFLIRLKAFDFSKDLNLGVKVTKTVSLILK